MSIGSASLGDLVAREPNSFVDGPFGSNLKASEYQDTGVPIIRLQNIRPHQFREKDIKFISPSKAADLARHDYRPGDLVIAKLGDPTGVACLIPHDFPAGRIVADVVRFRGDLKLADHAYISRYLNSPDARQQLEQGTTGTTRKRINLTKLKSVHIPLPPLPEQKRIAGILDAADALRAKRRESLAQLDTLLQSTFLDMFGDPVRGKVRRIADLAMPGRGTFSNGPFGSDLLTSELTDSGVPVVYIRDIRDGEYSRVSTVFVTEEKAKSLDACQVLPGDVLMAKVGDPPGVAAMYPQGEALGVITQDVIRIRPDTQLVLPEFLVSFFNSGPGMHLIGGITVEATRSRFGLRDLKGLAMNIPSLELQRRFAAIVGSIEQQKTTQRTHLAELDTLFASLQSRAFRGDL